MSILFHVSDLHFGREDPAALSWFAATVASERPDAVIVTGDLTSRARRREFEAAAAWLATLNVPITIEVGNHDLPYFNLWSRFVQPYARFEQVERAIERPLTMTDLVIVPMKTTARAQWRLNWAQGVVRPERLAETVAALKAAGDSRILIVTCHHPLVDRPGGHSEGKTRGGAAALAALAAAGADLVLSGHVHDPFDRMWRDGVRPLRMIGAGTLSERVRATRPSFNRIDIAGDAVTITTHFLN